MRSERSIQHEIRLTIGALPDVVLWRNNVGVADFAGVKVAYGLCIGSSDLIGILAGRFLAIETKRAKGIKAERQKDFIALVRARGGVAGFAYSLTDALSIVESGRRGGDGS